MDVDVLERAEAVQLTVILAPEADVDHQIRRAFAAVARERIVPDDDGFLLGVVGIAGKEFHIERLLFSRFFVFGGG